MHKILTPFLWITICGDFKCLATASEIANVTTEKFQIHFIDEVTHVVDSATQHYLNQLLQELQRSAPNDSHAQEFRDAQDAPKLKRKIVLIKQLLDLTVAENYNVRNFYTLRNVNFLEKFSRQLQQMRDDIAQEVRQLRLYNLCKQFWFRIDNKTAANDGDATETQSKKEMPTPRKPLTTYMRLTGAAKLAPIVEAADTAATNAITSASTTTTTMTPQPATASLNVHEFGRLLYANVKASGAEVIDDYLSAIRVLLQEVIDEKHEHEQHAVKLGKLLVEIDNIIAIEDFYDKRQRLYAYLEHHLASDYELFKNSDYAEEDMNIILSKLKSKGLDLFISFLFSNFEFLERLHEEWLKLLPPAVLLQRLDEDARLMHSIHATYEAFKQDSENNDKYEAYMQQVKLLHAKTKNANEHTRIFELLHNASQNVGTVTFNMIRAKCDEIH